MMLGTKVLASEAVDLLLHDLRAFDVSERETSGASKVVASDPSSGVAPLKAHRNGARGERRSPALHVACRGNSAVSRGPDLAASAAPVRCWLRLKVTRTLNQDLGGAGKHLKQDADVTLTCLVPSSAAIASASNLSCSCCSCCFAAWATAT